MGLEQGRLWALKGSAEANMILHDADSGLPTLFSRKKGAESFTKSLKATSDVEVFPVEVEIVEKKGAEQPALREEVAIRLAALDFRQSIDRVKENWTLGAFRETAKSIYRREADELIGLVLRTSGEEQ